MSMQLAELQAQAKKDGKAVPKSLPEKVYDDGRTKQSFKDETDINKILQRAQKAGTLSHLERYQPQYGDFSDFDFQTAQLKLAQGAEIFDRLPAEIRKEFNQSPAEFFQYVNDPAKADKLRQLLPELAKPGRQRLDVSGRTPPEGVASAASGAITTTPNPSTGSSTESPSPGSTEGSIPS